MSINEIHAQIEALRSELNQTMNAETDMFFQNEETVYHARNASRLSMAMLYLERAMQELDTIENNNR